MDLFFFLSSGRTCALVGWVNLWSVIHKGLIWDMTPLFFLFPLSDFFKWLIKIKFACKKCTELHDHLEFSLVMSSLNNHIVRKYMNSTTLLLQKLPGMYLSFGQMLLFLSSVLLRNISSVFWWPQWSSLQ